MDEGRNSCTLSSPESSFCQAVLTLHSEGQNAREIPNSKMYAEVFSHISSVFEFGAPLPTSILENVRLLNLICEFLVFAAAC
ncbi:hypothetical protein E2C01_057255 [Portunus trituberculatus]|uniref:Uncharacterized protein n=1 Tax=Portunus trituberculatus TaxID=210409 RepID=A0A5B7GSG7_PORTR|nr:hypothetical protein [Portunus trituberculatus]